MPRKYDQSPDTSLAECPRGISGGGSESGTCAKCETVADSNTYGILASVCPGVPEDREP